MRSKAEMSSWTLKVIRAGGPLFASVSCTGNEYFDSQNTTSMIADGDK